MHHQPVLNSDADTSKTTILALALISTDALPGPLPPTRTTFDIYGALISNSYNFIVAFLITVPIPARTVGYSMFVTKSVFFLKNPGERRHYLVGFSGVVPTEWGLARARTTTMR